jgi:hypothetical protein
MDPIRDEPIKFRSDYQTDWSRLIRPLIKKRYAIKAPDMLSIQGDAPKAFLLLREEAPGYVPVGDGAGASAGGRVVGGPTSRKSARNGIRSNQ